MIATSQGSVSHNPPATLIAFDLRDPDAVRSLHALRARWQDRADLEALDHGHFALIVEGEVVR